MSKWESKAIEGIELYLYLQTRFNMSPDEAAETMKEKGHYTDDVCKAHTLFNKHALNQKERINNENR